MASTRRTGNWSFALLFYKFVLRGVVDVGVAQGTWENILEETCIKDRCSSTQSEYGDADISPALLQFRQQGERNLNLDASNVEVPMQKPRQGAGAPWSKAESLAVMAKLYKVFEHPMWAANDLGEKYECRTGGLLDDNSTWYPCDGKENRVDDKLSDGRLPDAAKFVRLGFHDCARYMDGSGGCDGCLEFTNMFTQFNDLEAGNSCPNGFRRADPETDGDNNNLALSADVLEAIFTQPGFPPDTPILDQPLNTSGKSRADLWAFASLAATHYSFNKNNLACRNETRGCQHIYNYEKIEHPCQVHLNHTLRFFTGRRDCTEGKPTEPAWYRRRPYETTRREKLPNAHWTGPMVVSFMKSQFDFSTRETAAIMGAHSLGNFHHMNDMFRYVWKRNQREFLNNDYYRIMMAEPHYYVNCDPWRVTGGPGGIRAKTGWFVLPSCKTASGGPFQWFHYYYRCPDCWNGTNRDARGSGVFKTDYCCKECSEKTIDTVDPQCMQKINHDETAVSADVGLYFNFSVGDHGLPVGCPGFGQKWTIKGITSPKWWEQPGKVEPLCPKNEMPVEGNLKLYQLIETYAHDQDLWAADFTRTFTKMLSNGYAEGELQEGPDVFDLEAVTCTWKDSLMKCTDRRDPTPAPTPVPTMPRVHILNRSTCADLAYKIVKDPHECKSAAELSNHNYNYWSPNMTNWPAGCVLRPDGQVHWNQFLGNTPCGSGESSCICFLPVGATAKPTPAPTPAPTPDPTPAPTYPQVHILNTGTCIDLGYTNVKDWHECMAAAELSRHRYNYWSPYNVNWPPGCVLMPDGQVHWNQFLGNTPCGSEERSCICFLPYGSTAKPTPAPTPEPTPDPTPTPTYPQVHILNTGTCIDKGYTNAKDWHECKTAAELSNHNYNYWSPNMTNWPAGCVLRADGQVHWNQFLGNTPCGSGESSCICFSSV